MFFFHIYFVSNVHAYTHLTKGSQSNGSQSHCTPHCKHMTVVERSAQDMYVYVTVHTKRAHFAHLVIFDFFILNETRLYELTVT